MEMAEQQLWTAVEDLWEAAMAGNLTGIEARLHRDYSGWVTGQEHITDFAKALSSVSLGKSQILHYDLKPMKVSVYENQTGVVHYCYQAKLQKGEDILWVKGRWTEIYTRLHHQWICVAVSGGPDGER